jgi:ClpP class serine protease
LSQNLDTLFTSHFYIDKTYGAGLVPSLLSMYQGRNKIEKTEADKIKEVSKVYLSAHANTSALNKNEAKVVVLDFKQPVIKYSTYYWLGTQTYISILERLKSDSTVVGVVIDIDSGGGQVYGTPEMYDVVSNFAKTKPIGFYTNGYLCSGAYYIAAAGTFIMANKRADAIGSIGGYTIIVDYDGLLEKFGAKVHTIYSDLSPDKNKGFRNVVEGNDPDYKNYIKEELNPMVETFHVDMKSIRPQLKEVVFKGGTWTGVQAIEMGLVDCNGSLPDAIAKAFEEGNSVIEKSNKNKTNLKIKTMSGKTKNFPAIQSILGMTEEGIGTISTITGKKGVQITEAQLDVINNALAEKETAVTSAKGQVTKLEGAVNAAIKTAGLDADVTTGADTETKITLLGAKVVEYGNKPGAKITKPIADGDAFEEKENIVNASDDHNEIYNKA